MLSYLTAKDAAAACLLPAHDPVNYKVVELELKDPQDALLQKEERDRFQRVHDEIQGRIAHAQPGDVAALQQKLQKANLEHHVNCAKLAQRKREANPVGLQVYSGNDPHSQMGIIVRKTGGLLAKTKGVSSVLPGDRVVMLGLKNAADSSFIRQPVDVKGMPYTAVVELFGEFQEDWRSREGGTAILCIFFDNPLGKYLRAKVKGSLHELSDSFFNVATTQRTFQRFSKGKLFAGQKVCELIVHFNSKTLQWDTGTSPMAGMTVAQESELIFVVTVAKKKKTKVLRLTGSNPAQVSHWVAGLSNIVEIMVSKSRRAQVVGWEGVKAGNGRAASQDGAPPAQPPPGAAPPMGAAPAYVPQARQQEAARPAEVRPSEVRAVPEGFEGFPQFPHEPQHPRQESKRDGFPAFPQEPQVPEHKDLHQDHKEGRRSSHPDVEAHIGIERVVSFPLLPLVHAENKRSEPAVPPIEPSLVAILERHHVGVTPDLLLELQKWKLTPSLIPDDAPPSYEDL